jgi:hypothetical protein
MLVINASVKSDIVHRNTGTRGVCSISLMEFKIVFFFVFTAVRIRPVCQVLQHGRGQSNQE